MKKIMILGVMFFMGCANSPRRLVYPMFTVVEASQREIQEACSEEVAMLDDGTMARNVKVAGCYNSEKKEIWVQPYNYSVLLHELCHAGGIDAKTCGEKYH